MDEHDAHESPSFSDGKPNANRPAGTTDPANLPLVALSGDDYVGSGDSLPELRDEAEDIAVWEDNTRLAAVVVRGRVQVFRGEGSPRAAPGRAPARRPVATNPQAGGGAGGRPCR
jgi:hypothetical protein